MRFSFFVIAILLKLTFLTDVLKAQDCCDIDGDVDLCYLSGADYCASNTFNCFGYSLDGIWMNNALQAKLTSPANFGPNGTVDCELNLKKLESSDVASVQAINDCGCDMIFVPNVFVEPGTNILNLDTSYIPVPVLQTIYDWSIECENNLVILTQNEANIWGYVSENANVNPNTPVAGTSLFTIFDGPFGSLDEFSQGGAYQGVFTQTPPTGHEVLARDANQNPTAALDLFTNDIVVGDVGIFCSGGAGVVTAGPNIVNNNDILICNLFALACQITEEQSTSLSIFEICPGETVTLPDGEVVSTAGTYIDTLTSANGCDSIITTAIAYGIQQADILPEDTLICKFDTITLDGNLPYDLPAPVFTNTTTFPVDPPGINIISSIEVAGFSTTLLGPNNFNSVCINIDHPWVDDIDVLLVAPNGEFVELTSDNGLSGNNYEQTCFTLDAAIPINDPGATPPFTGDWLPEGDLSALWDSPVNGTWQLVVRDDSPGFTGSLIDWSISFQPSLELFYNWEEDVGITCTDCPTPGVAPPSDTNYYLTITDSYGCQIEDSIAIFLEDVLPEPVALCDSIGEYHISVVWDSISGAIGYEINIDGQGYIPPNNGDLAHFISGLTFPDTVTIQVRAFDDCKGEFTELECITPDCPAPIPNIVTINTTSCFGSADGAFSVDATGGTGPITYELNGDVNATGSFTGLTAGIYEVMILDSIGCDAMISVEVEQPDSIALDAIILDSVDCFDGNNGSVGVEILSGGTGPFSFDWGLISNDSIQTGLTAGDYSVVVTDQNGCTAAASIALGQPDELTATTDSSLVSCNGDADGTASVTPQGGTAPFSYLWDVAASSQTTSIASGLSAGSYEVTVTDVNNCTFSTSVQVNEPPVLTASLNTNDPLCNGAESGSIEVIPDGGTPEYNYAWSDPSLSDDPFQNDLGEGNYSVTITDLNGCTATAVAQLNDPPPIEITAQQSEVSCFEGEDGSITVSLTGAVGSPVFSWDNGVFTPFNLDLSAGTYCLTVTDDNECEAEACYTITQPSAIILATDSEDIPCGSMDVGVIDLTASGGTSPYTFLWSEGSTTEDIDELAPGDYTVTVTDGLGCEAVTTNSVEELPPPFGFSFIPIFPVCHGDNTGSIDLSVNGSFNDLDYSWTGPDNFTASTQDIDNLTAGLYNFELIDDNGCTLTGTVEIEQPAPINLRFEKSDVSCPGEADGSIVFYPEGGIGPYVYSLNGGASFSTQTIYRTLSGGDYQVVVGDANGCEVSQLVTIKEAPEITIDIVPKVTIDFGESYQYDVQLTPQNPKIDSIVWTPPLDLSCINCLDPVASPEFTTFYQIEIFAGEGCITTARTTLVVDRPLFVYIPNAFSPNNDSSNDIFMVFGNEFQVAEINRFQVFDRWGEMVYSADNFQPNDPAFSWDGTFRGKDAPGGVYAWFVEVEMTDGSVQLFKGDVTLVR